MNEFFIVKTSPCPSLSRRGRRGFTLLEVLIGVTVMSLITLALFSLFNFTLKVSFENKARATAAALAIEKVELARNLPYFSVGTVGGLPPGPIEPTEQLTRNSIPFTVKTDVFFVDDTFDGTQGGSPDDILPVDYKKVRVEVSWPYRLVTKPVVHVTNVAPKGLEGGFDFGIGTLELTIFDSLGIPVGQADVSVVNTSTIPTVNINTQSSDTGKVIIPGAPTSTQSYQISVSKTGYSSDQTMTADASLPQPDKPHLAVFEGQITAASFSIDLVSTLDFAFQDASSTPIGNLDFHLQGVKRLGLDGGGLPVPKYSSDLQTGAAGTLNLSNMEWDSYTTSVATSTGWDIAQTDPIQPMSLAPATSTSVTVTLAPTAAESLLVIVEDVNNQPVSGADARLTIVSPPYDQTLTTGSAGQTFFTPLTNASSTLQVSKTGFTTEVLSVSIDGYSTQRVILTQP